MTCLLVTMMPEVSIMAPDPTATSICGSADLPSTAPVPRVTLATLMLTIAGSACATMPVTLQVSDGAADADVSAPAAPSPTAMATGRVPRNALEQAAFPQDFP